MKKLILIAAVAALAGCNKQAEEAPAPTETAAATETAATATTAPGTYTVTDDKGPAGTTVINADGTYVDTAPDGKEVKGKFASKDGKDCFDPEGDEPEVCWTITAPGANGAFKATTPDGKMTVMVAPAKP